MTLDHLCAFDGCGARDAVRGLCRGHYNQGRKGRPLTPITRGATPSQRFMQKVRVDEASGCWWWTAATIEQGYGRFYLDGRGIGAHRASLLLAGDSIPDHLEVDHLCRNTLCVNPDHLDVVTHQINMDRFPVSDHAYGGRTHCPAGHEYTAENTAIRSDGGGRRCRQCAREKARRERARHAAAQAFS